MVTETQKTGGSAAVQGDLWGAAAQDWADLQEGASRPLWIAMLDAAGLRAGERLLDAGCGSGGAAVIASERGAFISGYDAAALLIAIARRRIPSGDFRLGDLETLPYASGSFDVVLATNSVQYAANPVNALRELRRVCAPNGRVVVASWDAPEHNEMRDVFKAVVGTLPAPPTGEGPFALAAPGALEALLTQAGLQAYASGHADCAMSQPDAETFWRAQRSAGPLQGAIRAAGEEKVKTAVLQAAAPYQTPGGGYLLHNRFKFVVARP